MDSDDWKSKKSNNIETNTYEIKRI